MLYMVPQVEFPFYVRTKDPCLKRPIELYARTGCSSLGLLRNIPYLKLEAVCYLSNSMIREHMLSHVLGE